LKTALKAKMLTFVLPYEKHLVVSFWTFFKFVEAGIVLKF